LTNIKYDINLSLKKLLLIQSKSSIKFNISSFLQTLKTYSGSRIWTIKFFQTIVNISCTHWIYIIWM